MSDRRIVVDANVLIRSLLGVRVEELFYSYRDRVRFVTPSLALHDAEINTTAIAAKHEMDRSRIDRKIAALGYLVDELPDARLEEYRARSMERIGRRDADDWPIVAAAFHYDCPIWTEDKDFFGIGIPVWSSDLVEIYLSNEDAD